MDPHDRSARGKEDKETLQDGALPLASNWMHYQPQIPPVSPSTKSKAVNTIPEEEKARESFNPASVSCKFSSGSDNSVQKVLMSPQASPSSSPEHLKPLSMTAMSRKDAVSCQLQPAHVSTPPREHLVRDKGVSSRPPNPAPRARHSRDYRYR